MDQVLQVDSTAVLSQVPEAAVTHWREGSPGYRTETPPAG